MVSKINLVYKQKHPGIYIVYNDYSWEQGAVHVAFSEEKEEGEEACL